MKDINSSAFFDEISPFYDEMISFNSALEKRAAVLKNFIGPGMKQAADAGCGTGLDSISISKLGLQVTAFDPSEGMLNRAMKNADISGSQINFYKASLAEIPVRFDNSFEIAVSLGNTVANVTPGELPSSFSRLFSILKTGGRVLIQILNYEKIRLTNERIVNITRHEGTYFIRFYDFSDDNIVFNVLKFNAEKPGERQLNSTLLYPYEADFIKQNLQQTGFRDIELYGSLNKDPFKSRTSPDIVITALK